MTISSSIVAGAVVEAAASPAYRTVVNESEYGGQHSQHAIRLQAGFQVAPEDFICLLTRQGRVIVLVIVDDAGGPCTLAQDEVG